MPEFIFWLAKMTTRESSSSKLISQFRAPHPEIRGDAFLGGQKITRAFSAWSNLSFR